MTGLRADKKTLARWTRKAKAAGLSFNKWAHIVLNNAPDVTPAAISKEQAP
jgi:predicted HicB family RNase H-like nuclease